jgi:predicted permease
MRFAARLRNTLRLILRRHRVEADLHDEVQGFFDAMTERFIEQGMTPVDARRAVRLRFSGTEQVKEEVRDVRAGAAFDFLLREARYALRRIRQNPVFAFVTILTLALGIGANSTVFSVVSRFALQLPPVDDPERLLFFYTVENGENCCSNNQSYPLYKDLRDQAKSFSQVAACFELVPAAIDYGGNPERIWGQAATTNYFDTALVPLTLGRGFHAGEDESAVVVIGHRVWQNRFQQDPNIIGKVIRLSGQPFTVVGVAPPSFRGLDLVLDAQFWVPLGTLPRLQPDELDRIHRGHHWLNVIGRLAPGVTRTAAEAELQVIGKRLSAQYPAFHKDLRFRLQTAGGIPVRFETAVKLFLTALTIVAFLVFTIACVNVANLAHARVAARQQEFAVRTALGASRKYFLAPMIIEAGALAIAGGICAVAFSVWATRGLRAFHLPAPVPMDVAVAVDSRTIIYTFCLSLLAGLICGFLPAWTVMKGGVSNAIKGQDRLAQPGRYWTFSNVLVAVQLGMSVVLLCSTVLFLRSLHNASRIEIGFRSNGILTMDLDPRLHGYSPQRTAQFLDLAKQKAAEIPGVEVAAFADSIPLSGGHRSDGFALPGRQTYRSVDLFMVSPDYLKTLGIPLLSGRDFAHESARSPRVAIVDEEFVPDFFPDRQALNRQVSDGGSTYTIIGVVRDIKSRTIGEQTRPVLFRLVAQNIEQETSVSGYSVVVKYRGDVAAIAAKLRETIHQIDPALAIVRTQTMQEHLDDAFFLPRLASTLFTVFGSIGLTLTLVGIYGLMNYWVSRSTREIGIRLAIGARPIQVQGLVIRKGLRLVAISSIPGLLAALGLNRLYPSLLYGLSAGDPFTYMIVPVMLAAFAALACWFPAMRVTGNEPLAALRDN